MAEAVFELDSAGRVADRREDIPPDVTARLEALEKRLEEYDRIMTQIGEAVEKAKANPMIANLMRTMGL